MRHIRAAIARAQAIARVVAIAILAFWGVCMAVSLLPFVLGGDSYVITSGSMTPAVWTGDIVVTKPTTTDRIRPGQIVAFVDPVDARRILVHRCLGRHPDGTLITKGDANLAPDPVPVPARLLRGVARARIPAVGLPAYWFHTDRPVPLITTLLGLVAAILVATSRSADTPRLRPQRRRFDRVRRLCLSAGCRELPRS